MKLFGSLLLASSAQAATLCTATDHTDTDFVNSLIVPSCDHEKFVLEVDEKCRAAEYNFINWQSTFVDGVKATVTVPTSPGATCTPVGTSGKWTYTTKFNECNIAAPVDETDAASGITYSVYVMYINFDGTIAAAQGTGNLQQLGQTEVKCRVPKNLQENAIPGKVTITDSDAIPDMVRDIKLWEFLQLDVYTGGKLAAASWGASALTAGASIDMGEHIKLKIDNQASGTVKTNYEVAIHNCWASTVENRVAGQTDTGKVAFDATGADADKDGTADAAAHKTVKFWEAQCPKYNWVLPLLDTTAAAAITSNDEITLRQFAFNDAAGMVADFWYHCEVNICPKSTDCVPDPGCAALTPVDNTPANGRRRRAIISSKRMRREDEDQSGEVQAKQFSLGDLDCEHGTELDGETIICRQGRSQNEESGAQALGLGVLTGALACALH